MKLIIAGIGFSDLITLRALRAAESADIILVPRANLDTEGYAERFIKELVPDKRYIQIHFPMTASAKKRDAEILSELDRVSSELEETDTIFFPVIGDSMLYSTGKYLLSAFRELVPDIEAEFIPGISAHSLAAACAKKFLAMNDEIFAVIPGTADREHIRKTLTACDCAAIYKPTALTNPQELLRGFKVVRVDYAGIPERERIIYGEEALSEIHDYLSIILLWRD